MKTLFKFLFRKEYLGQVEFFYAGALGGFGHVYRDRWTMKTSFDGTSRRGYLK